LIRKRGNNNVKKSKTYRKQTRVADTGSSKVSKIGRGIALIPAIFPDTRSGVNPAGIDVGSPDIEELVP